MSAVVLGAGQQVSFCLYADCPSSLWATIAQTENGRAITLAAKIRRAAEALGSVADVKAEAVPKSAGDTVLSSRVAGFVPRANVDTDAFGAAALRELNAGAPRALWLPHVSAARNAPLLATAPVLAPIWAAVGLATAVSDTADEAVSNAYRRLGYVVDTGSVERGQNNAPPPASTIAGRAAAVAAGGTATSTDAARDNRTPAAAAATAAGEALSWTPPPWLLVGGVIVAGLVGAVGLGYAARGVAQLVRETK